MRKQRLVFIFLILTLLALASPFPALAQNGEELSLRLRRTFGYSSGGDMQGVFSLRAEGPEDLQKVAFYIDGDLIAEDSEAPFSVSFSTDDYALGTHTLHAEGFTSGGLAIQSREIRGNFVTAEEGWRAGARIAAPLVGLMVVLMLVSTVPMLLKGKKLEQLPLGAERKYGVSGGGICPRCKRPFALHFGALNLVGGKLDRCPYCGKWSVVRRQPIQKLREAERAELAFAQPVAPVEELSPEEKLRKDLDDSKYLSG